MAVTASMVKELREISGAGMVDCKNALVEADADVEKALEILREKGMAAAVKKAGRIASEGLCYTYISEDNKTAVIIEINSETDFVAKNQEFKNFVDMSARHAASCTAENMDEFFTQPWTFDTSMTVRDALNQKISATGENLNIRRYVKYTAEEGSVFVSYIHGGGKVAVLLELTSTVNNAAIAEAGKNICMQIAAMSPQFVRRSDISDEFIQKEREILTQQAINEGKPQNIAEKMVEGRLNKELKSFCLLEQEYVKDSEFTVDGYLKAVGKENSATVTVKRFVRYETGEGLEKKEENFAEEVSKAMQG
ncbi:MAG: translation elongation factor Ts [Clostridiales bacterium]|jgi:elongation factor Ts|nr:translation elongation factor Ts [Clostridiales bacterium]